MMAVILMAMLFTKHMVHSLFKKSAKKFHLSLVGEDIRTDIKVDACLTMFQHTTLWGVKGECKMMLTCITSSF